MPMSAILPSVQIIELLRRLPLFAGIADEELRSLADTCRVDRIRPDAAIFRTCLATLTLEVYYRYLPSTR